MRNGAALSLTSEITLTESAECPAMARRQSQRWGEAYRVLLFLSRFMCFYFSFTWNEKAIQPVGVLLTSLCHLHPETHVEDQGQQYTIETYTANYITTCSILGNLQTLVHCFARWIHQSTLRGRSAVSQYECWWQTSYSTCSVQCHEENKA